MGAMVRDGAANGEYGSDRPDKVEQPKECQRSLEVRTRQPRALDTTSESRNA